MWYVRCLMSDVVYQTTKMSDAVYETSDVKCDISDHLMSDV